MTEGAPTQSDWQFLLNLRQKLSGNELENNIKNIQDYHGKILETVDSLDEYIDSIMSKHESGFIDAFKMHMY